jgi:uncharacterized protein
MIGSSMYKLSHYLVFTDVLNDKHDRIVFSTRSCKSLLISALCYSKLIAGSFSEIPLPLVQKLVDRNVLVPAAADELAAIISDNKQAIEGDQHTLYEVIQPSANCQLGCYYCGQTHTKKSLAPSVAGKITERIKTKLIGNTYKSLDIGWFGGEPLLGLASIRNISAELISFCNTNNIRYAAKMVSNGLGLKENIFRELVKIWEVKQIEITVDGVGDFHDGHRYTKKGTGSFSIIFQNLLNAISIREQENLDCKISVRCNVDRHNVEGVTSLIQYLASYQLQGKIDFYVANIYSWAGNNAHNQSLTKEEFATREIEWRKEMIRHGFAYGFDLPKRKKVTCMIVSKNSEMYDANGNVFNCTETSYAKIYEQSAYHLGNLESELPLRTTRHLADWNDRVENDHSLPCNTCNMLPVCGGSCPKSWEEGNPACPSNKFNLKDKLALNYKIMSISTKEPPLRAAVNE